MKCDKCESTAKYDCVCSRCNREPDYEERFHACEEHVNDVSENHARVRGYGAKWNMKVQCQK